ncbi:hypothetical protein BX666DRAFT_1467214 [Dichotomocladium elegans]|nr:hypothetical protein BX666DRAFT_1467214 [Dichotomocladium elegans]
MCVADDGIDLTAILSQCTNLTHLRYCAPDLKNIEIDSASCISGTSKLISLQLITSSISFDNFASRLRYATQIQMLVLCECEPDVMDALNQYAGPDLEYLHINPNLDCIFPPFVDVEYTVRGGGGLSTVIANKMDTHALDKLIAMLVNRAQSSLQHLHITTIPAAHAAFPGINSVHFGALRTLFWGGITPSLGFAVAVVIRESPCLEELTLQDCEVVDAEMLSALSGLKRLEKLAIIRATDIDHTHLARFFLAHGELMHASPLNEFELVGCSSVLVPDTLSALSTVLTLRRLGLGIQGKDQRVSVAEMDQFLTRLSKNACALESVTLTSLNIVTDTGLLKLGEAEGLIEVVLTNLPRITNQGVHRFVDACSSLRSVRIEQCPLVLDNALADLEKKLLQRAMKYM